MTDTTAEDLLAHLPKPPFFARLKDARATLDALQWHAHPELDKGRYFIVVEQVLDRDEQHPGLWVRPLKCKFWIHADDCYLQYSYGVN